MAKTRKTAKRKQIATVTMIRLLLLALGLIIDISITTRYVLEREFLGTFADFSFSYARIVADQIDGDAVERYVETGETDAYYDDIQQTMQGMVDHAELRYLYVVIPEETGLLYVWDAQLGHAPRPLLDRWAYTGNYPSDEAKLAYQTGQEQFCAYHYKGVEIASAITPVFDSRGEVAAIVEADILMPRIETATRSVLTSVIFYVALIMAVAIPLFYYFTRKRIIVPLEKISKAANGMVGFLHKKEAISIDIHTGDEIEQVARDFEEMDRKLLAYVREYSKITAENERIETELNMAAAIQTNLLPREYPAFPDRSEFEICAMMEPAKEVGGDFYDYFMVDEDHLAMVVADTSGKGVPAALFSMIAKTLLKMCTQTRISPERVLAEVNAALCENNEEEMFVTVWLGVLEISTGELTYADAGHERLLLYQNGTWRILPKAGGIALAALTPEDLEFVDDAANSHNQTIRLNPGDAIFQYTDGVTEAATADRTLFGEERLLEAANSAPSAKPEEFLPYIRARLAAFVQGAPQTDDITMLGVQFNGSEKSK